MESLFNEKIFVIQFSLISILWLNPSLLAWIFASEFRFRCSHERLEPGHWKEGCKAKVQSTMLIEIERGLATSTRWHFTLAGDLTIFMAEARALQPQRQQQWNAIYLCIFQNSKLASIYLARVSDCSCWCLQRCKPNIHSVLCLQVLWIGAEPRDERGRVLE